VLADLLFYGVVGATVCVGCYLGWRGIDALAVMWMAARDRRSGAGFVPSPPVRLQAGRLDARPRPHVDRPRLSVLPQPDSRVVDLKLAARVAACRRSGAPSSPFTMRHREGIAQFTQRRQSNQPVAPWGGEGGAA
jgi:hypothetical protein